MDFSKKLQIFIKKNKRKGEFTFTICALAVTALISVIQLIIA